MPDALKIIQIKFNIFDDPTIKFVSITLPRYLKCVTHLMTSPLIKISGLTEFLILCMKYIQIVLLTFRVKQEFASPSDTLLIAVASLVATLSLVLAWVKITLSSA